MAESGSDGYPEAVLWDMDGTLVDSEKLWDVALFEAAEWLGSSLTTAQRSELVGSNMATTARYLLGNVGRAVTSDAIDEVAAWIRSRTMALFSDELPWRPGAREALLATRAAGLRSALVTSTERSLTELALHTIGREHFDTTVCGDEVDGRNKPEPRPYLLAAERCGAPPHRCVAVEDSPPGVSSAVAAGTAVLAVPCDLPLEPGPRVVLRDSLLGVNAEVLADVWHRVGTG